MPKQPLRTNQIVSKLKAASSPVVHGTATNAIDALQLSLDSPTPIGAWVCQTTEGEKSLSVIDLGSSAYLGLDIDPKLGYINCYLASGAIVGNGDKGNQIKGPLFHFLSREDVNDTATQLINAGESKEIVNPNPSGEATATLEKLQVGETIYGIEGGSDVYELTLSVADSASLITYMQGTNYWSIPLLDIDIDNLMEYAAIKVKARVVVGSDPIDVECLLVKLAEIDSNSVIAQAVFISSDPVQLNAETTLFTIRINVAYDAGDDAYLTALEGMPYSILAGDISSESTPVGQVLTSNGQGGCTWQSPSGGGVEPNIIVNLPFASSALTSENGSWRASFTPVDEEGVYVQPQWMQDLIACTQGSGGFEIDTTIMVKTTDGMIIPMTVYVQDYVMTAIAVAKIGSYIYSFGAEYNQDSESGGILVGGWKWGTNDPSASNN